MDIDTDDEELDSDDFEIIVMGQEKIKRRKPTAQRKQKQLDDNECMVLNFHRQECLKILDQIAEEKRQKRHAD